MTVIAIHNISQVTEREIKGTSEFGPYRGKEISYTDDFGNVTTVAVYYDKNYKEVK